MKYKLFDLTISMVLTLMILIFFNIFSSAVMPILGLYQWRLSFGLLIILYLGFKVHTPYTGILILIIQYFQSAFSIEGWAYGTVAGVVVCTLVSFVKDMLNFTTYLSTMIVTQIFQIVWFVIIIVLLYLKTGNLDYFTTRLIDFIPESIIISLLSPFFFVVLDKVWRVEKYGPEVNV